MGVGRYNLVLILNPSLCLTTIALFAEGVIQVIADDTYPIIMLGLGKSLGWFEGWSFVWGKIIHLN